MDVKRAVTNEQKEKVLEIPDVFSKNDYYFDDEDTEQVSAILNNVAGTVNVDAEKKRDLDKLEEVSQNWKADEWTRVMLHAPHEAITAEIDRRLRANDEVNNSVKYLNQFLSQVKM